ncbi:hypothetical protein HEP75_04291 [Xanthomonas sp. SI]|nr:hypothetical protein HEP75_04291 [Xanthomonas sp. SI]
MLPFFYLSNVTKSVWPSSGKKIEGRWFEQSGSPVPFSPREKVARSAG